MSRNPAVKAERTLAILLAVSEWPSYHGFSNSPSFKRSAESVAEYFKALNGLSLSEENTLVLIDSSESAPELLRRIHEFITHRCDVLAARGEPASDLLFYYIGHGGFGRKGAFFFSLRSTHAFDPQASSLLGESLVATILDAAADLRKYIILDCCFAASVTGSFMSGPVGAAVAQLQDLLSLEDEVGGGLDELPRYGTALLCASGSRQPAKAPVDLTHTMFTGGLLHVLYDGNTNSPPWLSLNDLQRLVKSHLRSRFKDEAVLPEVHAPQQGAGRVDLVPVFKNPARNASSPPRPAADPQARSRPQDLETKSLELSSEPPPKREATSPKAGAGNEQALPPGRARRAYEAGPEPHFGADEQPKPANVAPLPLDLALFPPPTKVSLAEAPTIDAGNFTIDLAEAVFGPLFTLACKFVYFFGFWWIAFALVDWKFGTHILHVIGSVIRTIRGQSLPGDFNIMTYHPSR